MIKEERLSYILDKLKQNEFIRVADITEELDVTDMTVRRDLKRLEEQNLITRVHGGAKLIDNTPRRLDRELSHFDKVEINIAAKKEVAKKIAQEINDNETIFLGAGTTIEHVHEYWTANNVKVITNSLYLFNRLKDDERINMILIGGTFRKITGCFVGTIANDSINNIHVQKSFIGVNGMTTDGMYTFSESEGLIQQIILNNSETRYIVGDTSKFNRKDFYRFYDLNSTDYLITNDNINDDLRNEFSRFVDII